MAESKSEYFLKEINIESAKGFIGQKSLSFAMPNNLPGSGLTVLIGQEKTGKTSVMQALQQIGLKGARKSSAAKSISKMKVRVTFQSSKNDKDSYVITPSKEADMPAGASEPSLIYVSPLTIVEERRPPGETKGAINNFKRVADEVAKHPLLFDALAEVW